MKRRLIPILRDYPGYTGKFIRDQALGAISNGTRVAKINSVHGDTVGDGELGTIVGSLDIVKAAPSLADQYRAEFLYFIEWDSMPRHIASVRDFRVGRAS
jgi:hypothetical protein